MNREICGRCGDWLGRGNGIHTCTPIANAISREQERIAALEAEVERLRVNDARYRWLRDQHWVEPEACFRLNLPDHEWANEYHVVLDAAIDAVLAAKEKL